MKMGKWAICVVILAIVFIGTPVCANLMMNINLQVNSVFGLSLEADQTRGSALPVTVIDFGKLRPSQGYWQPNPSPYGLSIRCQSNNGSPWTVSVQATNFVKVGDSSVYFGPGALKIYRAEDPSNPLPGTWILGTSAVGLDSPMTLYQAGDTDTNTVGESVKVGFGLVVPGTALPGQYTSTVMFTLTQ